MKFVLLFNISILIFANEISYNLGAMINSNASSFNFLPSSNETYNADSNTSNSIKDFYANGNIGYDRVVDNFILKDNNLKKDDLPDDNLQNEKLLRSNPNFSHLLTNKSLFYYIKRSLDKHPVIVYPETITSDPENPSITDARRLDFMSQAEEIAEEDHPKTVVNNPIESVNDSFYYQTNEENKLNLKENIYDYNKSENYNSILDSFQTSGGCIDSKILPLLDDNSSNQFIIEDYYSIVSIYMRGPNSTQQYQGEGTLITPNHILTTARTLVVFTDIDNPRPVSPHMVLVRIMRRDSYNISFVERNASHLYINNDWLNQRNADNNFAIIELDKDVVIHPSKLIKQENGTDYNGLNENSSCSLIGLEYPINNHSYSRFQVINFNLQSSQIQLLSKSDLNGSTSSSLQIHFNLTNEPKIFLASGTPLICDDKIFGLITTNHDLQTNKCSKIMFIKIDNKLNWINGSIEMSKFYRVMNASSQDKISNLSYLMLSLFIAVIISKT